MYIYQIWHHLNLMKDSFLYASTANMLHYFVWAIPMKVPEGTRSIAIPVQKKWITWTLAGGGVTISGPARTEEWYLILKQSAIRKK